MSLAFGYALVHLPPHRWAVPSSCCRTHRKRRRLSVRVDLNPSPFENFFRGLVTQFPSVNSFNLIAPALGFASGLALFFSSTSPKLLSGPSDDRDSDSDIGEWILFTKPTPFNRFVTLRCPTIYFPGNELLEDVNKRLVQEDRHYVKLDSGRMILPVKSEDGVDEKMVYQRICVVTEDGGVLSLDWPANLDLEEERGLDTTVLIIPGTSEGSNERKIRTFSSECLRRGMFPVVMNPRGCARSPLTTPRLFTAADSDDISTAVQFISKKKRPWTTLMGIGWGYGANMLTKYLAESGERTPLMAATCVDNPFDLEEFTRSSMHYMDFEQRNVDGFINMLQCNKELFQGRGKGFDVERALSASSVRDFDEAISMVPFGFDSVEKFYAKCSTRDMVGKVKIPVLFIQNDDAKVPLFSIPRSMIAENPYTSLLLCSYSPSSKGIDSRIGFSWCQNLTLEWFMAVELGLLKGRHPLLKDVDVTINLSKGLALSDRSSKEGKADKLLNSTNGNLRNVPLEMSDDNVTAMSIQSRLTNDIGEPPNTSKGLQNKGNSLGNQWNASTDAVVDEKVNSSDDESGQVLQTTQVVMNMLDVTMPGILSDEQKMKVLNAVGQGETLIKALEDAVPEDVREKITTAVSGILQNNGSNMKFNELLGQIPDVASGLNSKVLDRMRTRKENGKDVPSLDKEKETDNHSGDGPFKQSPENSAEDMNLGKVLTEITQESHGLGTNHMTTGDMDLERKSREITQISDDSGANQYSGNHENNHDTQKVITQISEDSGAKQFAGDQGNNPDTEKVNLDEGGSEYEQSLGSTSAQTFDRQNEPGVNANEEVPSKLERPCESDDIAADQKRLEIDDGKSNSVLTEVNDKNDNDYPPDQNKVSDAYNIEDKHSISSPTSETEGKESLKDNESGNSQKKEGSGPVSITTGSNSFNVSDALDALTGFDDSTQVAVNSVFTVIEGMIDQFDVDKNNGDKIGEVNGVKEEELSGAPSSENYLAKNDNNSTKTLDLRSNDSAPSSSDSTVLYRQNSKIGGPNTKGGQLGTGCETKSMPAGGELAGNFVKCVNGGKEKVPSLTNFPFKDPLYQEYFKKYLYQKMRNENSPDMDKKLTLHLDYSPEEGKWKLLEVTEDNSPSAENEMHEDGYREDLNHVKQRSKDTDTIVQPSYVILNSSIPQIQNQDPKEMFTVDDNDEFVTAKHYESTHFIKSIILKCLNVEIGRRVSVASMEELKVKLADEMEYVANAVSMEAGQEKLHMLKGNDNLQEKLGTLDGEKIIKVTSLALQDTQYLRRILPVGVVVGFCLVALRKFFNVATLDGDGEESLTDDKVDASMESLVQVKEEETSESLNEIEYTDTLSGSIGEEGNIIDLQNSSDNKVMVGAATAALGASALLVHQQSTETSGTSDELLNNEGSSNYPSKLDEIPKKMQNNIVTSLAEKALSVASPVVPLKEDGQVDYERLVSMLTELGQKGGILKLIGKVALLWSGICGAMSLTDKLISFLRLAEHPLLHRIFGFVFMVLLLWSPVILPLLPTIMRNWSSHSPFKIAEFASIAGLYVSILIMITLWGKRIRKYDDPLLQYGLDFTSVPKLQKNYLKGLVGGFILVLLIHTVNSALGFAHLCWPTTLSLSSSEPIVLLKFYAWMFFSSVKGIATATAVSAVEELLFRSWLPEEIATDFGYHHAIIISGLVFALSQRSLWEVPGLWLLSLSLSGARQRSEGSLSLPIGLRTGILASNFMLKTGGFLSYKPTFEMLATGGYPFQPFSGVVGVASSLFLAAFLYPSQSLHEKKPRGIRD